MENQTAVMLSMACSNNSIRCCISSIWCDRFKLTMYITNCLLVCLLFSYHVTPFIIACILCSATLDLFVS